MRISSSFYHFPALSCIISAIILTSCTESSEQENTQVPSNNTSDNYIECPPPEVDMMTSPQYCGSVRFCATAECTKYLCTKPTPCTTDQVCVSGKCIERTTPPVTTSCPAHTPVLCGNTCINPLTFPSYCGADSNCMNYSTCQADEFCNQGRCQKQNLTNSCAEMGLIGFVRCSGICIDPRNTNEYCGANANCEGYDVCGKDENCQNGVCVDKFEEPQACYPPCKEDQTCQNGVCVDKFEEPQACTPPCKEDQTCQNGVCVNIPTPITCATPNQVVCNGTCIDPMNSNEYCGASVTCTGYATCTNDETCQSGKCKPVECPDNQHIYQGSCEPDSVEHCGKHNYQCATEINGWQDGECSQGQCSATACIDNYHLHNHTCELDSKEHCGEHNQDCRSSMPGYLDGQCINHNCIATECLQTYHLYQNICEPDDEAHCGAHTTNCYNIQGYATGECVEKECYVNTCADGYHLDSFNNQCIADTNDCCGASCSSCTSPRVCSKGSCEAQCEAPLSKCNNECRNYEKDIDHCGGCNNPCTTDKVSISTHVTCTDYTCKAKSCRSGYHVYEGKCEIDNLDNCGEHGSNCAIKNSSMMSCESGICVVLACNGGYHIYKNTCESDSNANCGAHGTQCKTVNATSTCSGGECTFTCDPGFHTYNNGCEADDTENCGAHSNACSVTNGTMACESGKCVIKQCNGNYHVYGDICEADSITNCGAHGTQCKTANATNACSGGKCTFTCKNGFEEWNNACEPITNEPFISTWDVKKQNVTVQFPIQGRSGTIIIDWGDGTSSTISSGTSDFKEHRYNSANLYTIKVTGKMNEWSCYSSGSLCKTNEYQLNSIQSYGNTKFGNNAFYGTDSAFKLPTEGTPRFNNNEMIGVFANSGFNQNINFWNTSNVTNMASMFRDASSFNQPLDNWNTSNVTNMASMFNSASSFNQPLDNWNTSNVTNMSHMFGGAKQFDQPLNNWDTSKVTDMSYMFSGAASFNQPLNNWNTSNVKSMSYMFNSAASFVSAQ